MSDGRPARRPGSNPLSADGWGRLESLVDILLDTPPERRPALFAELSGGDPARRSELEQLVAECEREHPLLDRPASERFESLIDDHAVRISQVLGERYRITRELARGGMAVVYLAWDIRHSRDVAVKVVRAELAAALGTARFLREIEIAARLRHPHIVPLYDSGEVAAEHSETGRSEGDRSTVLYYVMPYEPGDSLRERLRRDGPLPIDDAVVILRDVCDALAHAHAHGVVHRDIKPDNILLAGRHAMVTDFGIAHAMTEAATEATTTTVSTTVGTPAYMAPEQVAGDPGIDHRADIYAVGVLAYELLAGRPPFAGSEPSQVLAAHMIEAPVPVTAHRPDIPAPLAELVMKCLAKDATDRWQSADEVLAHLEPIVTPSDGSTPRVTGPSRLAVPAAITLGAVVLVVALAIATQRNRGTSPALVLGRASQLTSEPGLEVQPTMSPDGRQVAYAAGHSLQMRIHVRPVAGGRTIRLTTDTTHNEWLPRWSPDGTRVLFLSRGGVFSAPASGGPAREEIPGRSGAMVTSATWSSDGREIAYVRGDSLLARGVGTGGERLITTGRELHSCTWAPGGARLACVSGNYYYVTVGTIFGLGPMFGNLGPSRIVLIPAAGGAAVSVTDGGSLHQSPAWSPDGNTLYYVSNRQGPRDVYALDVAGRTPTGRDPVRITTGIGAQSIAFSSNGAHVVYAAYSSSANVWTIPIPDDPPALHAAAVPVTSGNQTVEGVRVSPDGRWVVYDSDLRGNSDVYRVPIEGGEPERLTSGPMDEFRGAISPNGRELTYHAFQAGSRNVFIAPLGGGPARQLTRSTGHVSMANWSPDGAALTVFDMTTDDVLVMRRDPAGRWGAPRVVARDGWRAEWSPDGRTVAFVSPTNGRIGIASADSGSQRDVYVPGAGDPWAELAIFSATGRELYFKSHDAEGRASFWSIPVDGGRPRLLVRLDDPARSSNRFEFASDGKRFFFTIEDRQSDIWLAEVVRP